MIRIEVAINRDLVAVVHAQRKDTVRAGHQESVLYEYHYDVQAVRGSINPSNTGEGFVRHDPRRGAVDLSLVLLSAVQNDLTRNGEV